MAGSREALTPAQIEEAMARLPGWTATGDRIVRDFQFADFIAALGFIVEVGALAERADHHPEIVNVYGHVRISLWTHDAHGITDLDVKMAEAIGARVPWLKPTH